MIPKHVKLKEIRHHWEIYLFVLPTVLLIGLFQYYPAASGVFHSLYRWNGADISEWVGLDNYFELFRSHEFWQTFQVALFIGGWNVVKMIPPLLVAVCIHRCRSLRMQFIYRALFVIPMVIPYLVIVLIWKSFFFEASAGYLNSFLNATGVMNLLQWLDGVFGWGGIFAAGQSPAWLGDPRIIIVACVVWGFPWVGSFAVLTHLAKLQGIGSEVYEAAEVDGVGWWSKFWRIELPLISSSIYLLLVFVIIDTLKDAGTILALAGMEGGPGGTVTVPALYMLRKAFVDQQMGFACAIGIVLTVIVLILQKMSAMVANWESLSDQGRTAFRGFLALVAGILICFQVYVVLAIGILAFVTPWTVVGRWLARWLPQRKPRPFTYARDFTPAERWRQRVTSHALRFGKHAAIWGILALAFLPLYLMIVVSLKDNRQFYRNPATPAAPFHFENWSKAWEIVTPAVGNSVFVSTAATALTVLLALGAAYFFARARMPLSGFLWNAILILMMMPTIANLVPLFRLLSDLNLINTLSALIIVGASAGQVFAIFVLRSFIQDLPQDLFEAAEIDGASHFRQLMMIVVPLSGPVIGTVAVMRFVAEWNEFVLPLIVIRDHAKLPVMVQLLRLAGEYVKFWGPLMAGYALASIPIIFLFIASMKLFVRGLTDGGTKG